MSGVGLLGALFQYLHVDERSIPVLFPLAVLLVACVTPGYVYSAVASVLGVLIINYYFMLPYFAFDFIRVGYPITFVLLLATSFTASTLMTRYRAQARRAADRNRVLLEMEAEKTRSNLLRAISHDLRTPLTSILGSSGALIESDAAFNAETRQQLYQDIHESAQWLLRMVENLLSATRMRAGGAAISKKEEIVEEVVADAVGQLRRRFPQYPLKVRVPEALLIAPMEGTLIAQVLINLVENAIYHSESQDGVLLEVLRQEEQALFRIRDYGKGVDIAKIEALFRGQPVLTEGDGHRGMGIGLSICASVIRAHGGEISCSNPPGGGAEFRFMLPLDPTA
jgi:two-component system sensor histidine kinase KdpD